jgi:hypothetical protein
MMQSAAARLDEAHKTISSAHGYPSEQPSEELA